MFEKSAWSSLGRFVFCERLPHFDVVLAKLFPPLSSYAFPTRNSTIAATQHRKSSGTCFEAGYRYSRQVSRKETILAQSLIFLKTECPCFIASLEFPTISVVWQSSGGKTSAHLQLCFDQVIAKRGSGHVPLGCCHCCANTGRDALRQRNEVLYVGKPFITQRIVARISRAIR